MNIEEELLNIKKKLESINKKKIESSTKLETLEEEKKSLLSECQNLGVDPKGIEEAMKQKETAVVEKTETIKKQLEEFNV